MAHEPAPALAPTAGATDGGAVGVGGEVPGGLLTVVRHVRDFDAKEADSGSGGGGPLTGRPYEREM